MKSIKSLHFLVISSCIMISCQDLTEKHHHESSSEKTREIIQREPIEKQVEVPAINGEREEMKQVIKSNVQADFPNDYVTQEYWIREQLQAYDFMVTVPDGPIKNEVEQDFPNDFVTQKYWYDEQVEAQRRMSN